MITKKKLKEEIITYDIITYKDDDGKDIEYVEVTLVDSLYGYKRSKYRNFSK